MIAAPSGLIEPLLAACAVALVIIGATAALMLANAIKRVAGLAIAGFGAVVALATLGAGDGALVAAVVVVFAQVLVGVALVVRLQERYSVVEAPEIDAADRDDQLRDEAQ